MRYLLFLLLFAGGTLFAQPKAISVADIWQTYEFLPERVSGFNFLKDGRSFTCLEDNKVVQYDLKTGEQTAVILDGSTLPAGEGYEKIDDYSFSADEGKILISSKQEPLYRRSSQAFYRVYDRNTKELTPVYAAKKHRLATLDPAGKRVAFVADNNIWIKDLESGTLRQVTTDGAINRVINGAADWVYEEEFSFSKAIHWSPDGKYLAYLKFDETDVPEFTYTDFHNDMYPEYNTFKYPKVGEENSTVSLHAFDTGSGQTTDLLTVNESPEDKWHYLPRVQWTAKGHQLTAQRLNRHQNELELLLFDLRTNDRQPLLTETSKYYVDIHDNLVFLPDGDQFIWTSEADGFNHVYLRSIRYPQKKKQLTSGQWDVTDFYGYHDGEIYYQAAKTSPLRREVYVQAIENDEGPQPLASRRGVNQAQFSDTYDYFVLTHSTINNPPMVTVMDKNGRPVRQIVDNVALKERMKTYGFQNVEFFDFETPEGTTLNGYLLKPANLSTGRKHPLLMHVYGGPGSQQVMDNWRGQNMAWFQMLTQRGFVVAVVDNRGTGARGELMKKRTYLQLGKEETEDQIYAAKYLGAKDFIDEDKIGIFGWSYGGFIALHSILQGNDVFAAAIAVAPVTNWKWYDSAYTERYMRTYEENKDGYDKNSPIYYANRLKGDLLLVHGMGDDNVHFQHTAEMANALIMANKQFDTYFYPNRNHGIYGGPTRAHLYTKMTDFLLEKIGPQTRQVAKGDVRIVPNDN